MKGIASIIVLVYSCLNFALCQVIPGLSPSKPNRLLKSCMSQSGPVNSGPVYNNHPANSVNAWCRTYGKAMPCIKQYIPTASRTDPNDWYLSLVYDEEYANDTSNAVCSRLKKYGNKMGCLSADLNNAETCISMLTSPIAKHMHKMFLSNQTSDVTKENSLRACLIPVTASRCFKPFFKTCRKGIRKLIAKYFMILSGKCLKIAKEHKKETTVKPTEDKTHTEEDSDNTNKLTTKSEDRKELSVLHVDKKEKEHRDEETSRPVMNLSKMRIIQRVVHSDIEKEPHNTVMSPPRLKVIPVKRVINVQKPLIRTNNIFFNREISTTQPSVATSIKMQIKGSTEVLHEDVSEDAEEVAPNTAESVTVSSTTDKTEDIYIADGQVLSAMKPLTEEEINSPDETEEVESIIMSFDNNTESSESEQSVEIKTNTEILPTPTETGSVMSESESETETGSVMSESESETETESVTTESENEQDNEEEESLDIILTTESIISEQEESNSEQDGSEEQSVDLSKTTQQVSIEITTQKSLKATKRVLSSLGSQRTRDSHGQMLSYNSLCITILTFSSLFFKVYI